MSTNTNNKIKISFKNQSDDIYEIESDLDDEKENILNLSRQNLSKIPFKIEKINYDEISTLILSKNKLCSFENLNLFSYSLIVLQLDRNNLCDDIIIKLPKLPNLKTLWLNNNNLINLKKILKILNIQCIELEYLSLLFNPLCPFTSICQNENEIKKYKFQIMTYLPKLKYLDICGIKQDKKNKFDNLLLNVIEIDKKSLKNSIILSEIQLKKIIYHCSSITHFCEWKCFYNTSIDGISKYTFYNNLSKIKNNKSIIIIKDRINHIFGAYIDNANYNKNCYHYKGSYDSFVFYFNGKYNKYNNNLYIYKSSGIQPYYLQCNDKYIIIGCGESPALYLNIDNFKNASTNKCKTFNSPPLTHTIDTQFIIHTVEVWAPC